MGRKILVAEPMLDESDVQNVVAAIRSGWISGRGQFVEEFENGFAKWLGARCAVTTSSGTSALHLALTALGVGMGDEVIIPAFSMAAIPFAVSYTGAKPVLVDSEVSTWNIDPSKIEEKITAKTKALVIMHTYGHPANMDPLVEISRKHGLYLVEDAAEAHGAQYKGKMVGTFGHVGCFSFFANKIITTGEGGMCVTSDSQLAQRAQILRDMAFSRNPAHKFLHESIGFNYRMTNMQAALGCAQLRRIDEFIDIRRRNAELYNSLLSKLPGVSRPPEASWARNVYWMYSVLISEDRFGASRERLMRSLSEDYGVETRPFFVPVHMQPPYLNGTSDQFAVAERLSASGLNLPSGNTLTTDQVEYVANALTELHAR